MCSKHSDTAAFYPAISINTIWKSSTDCRPEITCQPDEFKVDGLKLNDNLRPICTLFLYKNVVTHKLYKEQSQKQISQSQKQNRTKVSSLLSFWLMAAMQPTKLTTVPIKVDFCNLLGKIYHQNLYVLKNWLPTEVVFHENPRNSTKIDSTFSEFLPDGVKPV